MLRFARYAGLLSACTGSSRSGSEPERNPQVKAGLNVKPSRMGAHRVTASTHGGWPDRGQARTVGNSATSDRMMVGAEEPAKVQFQLRRRRAWRASSRWGAVVTDSFFQRSCDGLYI